MLLSLQAPGECEGIVRWSQHDPHGIQQGLDLTHPAHKGRKAIAQSCQHYVPPTGVINDLPEGYRLAPRGAAPHSLTDVAESMAVQLQQQSIQNPGHQIGAFINPTRVQLDQGRTSRDPLPGHFRWPSLVLFRSS